MPTVLGDAQNITRFNKIIMIAQLLSKNLYHDIWLILVLRNNSQQILGNTLKLAVIPNNQHMIQCIINMRNRGSNNLMKEDQIKSEMY